MRINPRSDSPEALMWDVICNVHRYVPRGGDRVLDLGAHAGMFALFCATRGCQVIAYEPTPKTFEDLQHSARVAHELGMGQIRPVKAAVWSKDGAEFLWHHPDTSGGNRLMLFGKKDMVRETTPITTVSLKTALQELPWDCVKVDIEGAEFEVFSNATDYEFGLINFLTIEIHNDLLPEAEIAELKKMLRDRFRAVDRLPVFKDGRDTGQDSALFCWR